MITELPVDTAYRAEARAVVALLREHYGRRTPSLDRHPTDCLIATILSQHTADRNSAAAYSALTERYRSWEEVAYADPDELAGVIRPAGLARAKARHIQAALVNLERRFGHMDLGFLRGRSLEEAQAILLSLPGVGPKTAACVLLFSCDLPALPVDTHVHRLSLRLGLIDGGTSAERAHVELQNLVEDADVYDFHVSLISHGRRVCTAREPRCGECFLQARCRHYGYGGPSWN